MQNAWNYQPEKFIFMYQEFLTTDYAKSHVTAVTEELQRAEQYISTQTSDDNDDNLQHSPQDEWMLLYQLYFLHIYANEDALEDTTDWEAIAR